MRRIRNGLVHPKPVGIAVDPDPDYYSDPLYAEFNPIAATPIVMAVARAASQLADAAPELGANVIVERAVLGFEPRLTELVDREAAVAPKLDYFERQRLIGADHNLLTDIYDSVSRVAEPEMHASWEAAAAREAAAAEPDPAGGDP